MKKASIGQRKISVFSYSHKKKLTQEGIKDISEINLVACTDISNLAETIDEPDQLDYAYYEYIRMKSLNDAPERLLQSIK